MRKYLFWLKDNQGNSFFLFCEVIENVMLKIVFVQDVILVDIRLFSTRHVRYRCLFLHYVLNMNRNKKKDIRWAMKEMIILKVLKRLICHPILRCPFQNQGWSGMNNWYWFIIMGTNLILLFVDIKIIEKAGHAIKDFIEKCNILSLNQILSTLLISNSIHFTKCYFTIFLKHSFTMLE